MTRKISPLEIGICSWSLKETREPKLRAAMSGLGLGVMQLALAPLEALNETDSAAAVLEFRTSPLALSAGMIAFGGENYSNLKTIRQTGGLVPDATARERLDVAHWCGGIAMALGLRQVSTHVGFIPQRGVNPDEFGALLERVRYLADLFVSMDLTLLFETGQERAEDLRAFLVALERGNVGVNFDPANMVLYGKGDPVEAVEILSPWIRHVHMKDAKRFDPPPMDDDAWRGRECPLGRGDAKLPEVVAALRRIGYAGPLIIEREAVGVREADVKAGIEYLRGL